MRRLGYSNSQTKSAVAASMLLLAACGGAEAGTEAVAASAGSTGAGATGTVSGTGGAEDVSGAGAAGATGGRAGGTAGGGGGSEPGFFGESRCDAAQVMFCDGFEGGTVDSSQWQLANDHGTAAVDGVHAARGEHAVHVTSPPAGGSFWLKYSAGLPLPDNSFFVRAFVYALPPLPTNNWNYLRIVDTDSWQLGGITKPFGDPDGNRVFRMMHQPLHEQLLSTLPFDTERWICWEMEYRGPDEVIRVWVDDVHIDALDVPNPSKQEAWQFPVMTGLEIGFHHAHDEPTSMEVWIDEVALDIERIGCEK